jgi:hypothetical protein
LAEKKTVEENGVTGGGIGIIMEKIAESEELRYLYYSDNVIKTIQCWRIGQAGRQHENWK